MLRSDIQLLIDAIQDNTPNTALEFRTVLEAIADGVDQTGDTKYISVPTSYIALNFDPTGLGTNERLGWAILNGNNGTENWGDRFQISYGSIYSILGATGGSADAVIPAHTHTTGLPSNTGGVPGSGGIQYNGANNNTVNITSSSTGVSATGKNMPPYLVTLAIVRL